MKKSLSYLFLAVLLVACSGPDEAEKIINQSIEAHGGEHFKSAQINFTFRERQYEIFKSPHSFRYTRIFEEEAAKVVDVLDDEGFSRTIDGVSVNLSDEKILAYTNSVNSVAYFAFLPYGLNDEAVLKEYLGKAQLEGSSYDLVKVTFKENGGGEDFQDEFLYWIHNETHLVDYLAYSYHTDGGGLRFRKAINSHEVSGLILQDYENYKPEDESIAVEDLSELFKNGNLELLSEILLENIKVQFVK
ncbi:DUF6503 family protein [uncultured Cyclobacterium sp.]|uniref:DUF6503 family protein n=1 Tax=uncultured Cyclobacterium sp. TaxID=453820 RepID=UPI0030ED3FCC